MIHLPGSVSVVETGLRVSAHRLAPTFCGGAQESGTSLPSLPLTGGRADGSWTPNLLPRSLRAKGMW